MRATCLFSLAVCRSTGFSLAYGRISGADNDVSRDEEKDGVEATDVTRTLDRDRGQLQQSASVVSISGALGQSPQLHQQLTNAKARSPGKYFTAISIMSSVSYYYTATVIFCRPNKIRLR